jgi:hypothetical protein
MIKIDFEFDTKYGVFRDALYLEDEHTYTPEEVDVLKQERVDNWLYIVENPPPPMPEDTIVDSIPVDAVLVEDSPVGAI